MAADHRFLPTRFFQSVARKERESSVGRKGVRDKSRPHVFRQYYFIHPTISIYAKSRFLAARVPACVSVPRYERHAAREIFQWHTRTLGIINEKTLEEGSRTEINRRLSSLDSLSFPLNFPFIIFQPRNGRYYISSIE